LERGRLPATQGQLGLVFCVSLPAVQDPVAIEGIQLAQEGTPTSLFGGDERRARSAEEIEHDENGGEKVGHGSGGMSPLRAAQ